MGQLKIIDLKKYSKLGISFQKSKNLMINNYKSLFLSFEANTIISNERNIITEISLSRHASSYGLLGAEFIPSNNNKLVVEIRYNENKRLYDESLSIHKGCTFIGLLKEFAVSVEKSISDYYQNSEFIPSGKLIISMGAYCNGGSSIKIFSCLSKILLEIIQYHYQDISDEQITEITRKLLIEEFI